MMASLSRHRLAASVLLLLILSTFTLSKKLQTHLSGFGCHSASKSIFAPDSNVPTSPATTTTLSNSPIWAQQTAEGLLLKNHNETICISMNTNGNWKATPYEPPPPRKDWIPIEGLYGVYKVPSGTIWVLITSTETVYENDYTHIRRVHGLELVHVPNTSTILSQRQVKEQARQIRLLRQALRHHTFYYSPTRDFTRSLQQQSLLSNQQQQQQQQQQQHVDPDSRFFWNEPCAQSLLESSSFLLSQSVIPVTSAFVGVQSNISLSDDNDDDDCKYVYDQVLISRRSRFRAGTRFTKRGANGHGDVANYAETEQTCWLLTKKRKLLQVSSHVQTRGSIPLRWSSPADVKTYRPKVRIGTDPLAQARAVQNHLVGEFARYAAAASTDLPQLVFVNLIDKHSDQGRLGRSFDSVLQAVLDLHANTNATTSDNDQSDEYYHLPPDSVQHVWFDFHAEVKHGNWERLGSLLNDLKPTLEEQGYFSAVPNNNKWTITRTQRGVIRTNCMDCLDRTNVVQSLFARFMLYKQLASVSVNKKRILFKDYTREFKLNSLTLPWSSGEVSHRLLWADNADAISRLYAGTPALKGDFTRTGKRTKKGALDDGMNSLQRYYLNNFLDADRQEGMDLLTGHADFTMDDDSVDLDAIENVARNMLLSLSDEERFAKQRRIAASRGLEMRWLPGDLQSHMMSHAWSVSRATQETLEAMDQRAASDAPWWVAEDTSSDEDDDNEQDDDEPSVRSSVKTGHVIATIIAAMQAPGVTAAATICMLGFSNQDKNDK